jgi:glycosyltransferase involved in cell wall biosynthesis/GT2 family glycosyltransferase
VPAPLKLTFVVATKDRPEELRRMWRSLCRQTRPPDEVVVVDAGAGPSPREGLDPAAFAATHIRAERPSSAGQRNAGLDAVSPGTDLVGFLDDDAVLEEGAVEEMLRFWEGADGAVGGAAFNLVNHPPLELASLKHTRLAESLGFYSKRPGTVAPSGFQTMIGFVERTTWTEWLPSGASVWRREVLRHHRFDEWFSGYSYLEDLDFSYRVAKTFRLAVVAGARYRHLPAAGGRGSGYMFGLREVLNRVRFVRANPELSLVKCRTALVVRLLMSVAFGIKEFKLVHLERAWGNAVGLVRSFGRGLAGGGGRSVVLVYGQVPPPYIGSNVMTQHFLAAVQKSGFEAVLSRKSLSGSVADVNRIRPVKVFRLLATWARFGGNLWRIRPALAVVFASSTFVGLAADSVIIALCRFSGVPYLLYLHTDVHRRVPAAPFPLRPVLSAVFRSAEACLVLGRAFRDELASQRPGRVLVLPNCVDDPPEAMESGPVNRNPKVLFLSNIEESKGIMTLLRAVPLVLAGNPGVTFSIVGPWRGRAVRRDVQDFLAGNALGRSVSLAGEAYGERKSEIMAQHDIFVLPSRREAMSLAVLEAMRASLPVISTDVGAMSEAVIDGVTGFLVPPDDPEALARRILELARNAPLRSAMGQTGRRRYEREFTPAVYEKNVREILNQVTVGGTPS